MTSCSREFQQDSFVSKPDRFDVNHVGDNRGNTNLRKYYFFKLVLLFVLKERVVASEPISHAADDNVLNDETVSRLHLFVQTKDKYVLVRAARKAV